MTSLQPSPVVGAVYVPGTNLLAFHTVTVTAGEACLLVASLVTSVTSVDRC